MTQLVLHSDGHVIPEVVFASVKWDSQNYLLKGGIDSKHQMGSTGAGNLHPATSMPENESKKVGNTSVAVLVEGIRTNRYLVEKLE